MDPERRARPQDGSPPDERPAKRRHRSAVACQRCKGRKQRCDNEFPSCSNCLCAGEPCVYGLKQIYPAEYVRSLESHIAQLERSMASADPTIARDHLAHAARRGLPGSGPGAGGGGGGGGGSSNSRAAPKESMHSPAGDEASVDGLQPSLEVGVGFVALSPNSFLGTSSGFPLAKLVKSAINVTRRASPGGRDDLQRTSAAVSPGLPPPPPRQPSTSHLDASSGTTAAAAKADMPSDDVGDRLIGAYFSKVHPKHPFLSRTRIANLNRNRAALVPAHQSRSAEIRGDRLDYAILHLVYAIGARYLQLANDLTCSSPEAHHAAALTDVDAISDVRSLENLEAMLLLSIYQLRSPTGPGIWWMIGTTMRHCLDCGLHRKSANASPLVDQRRKRIFWTAYMLERSVARTVGRPYAVADRDIDVDVPADIDDALETDEEVAAAMAEAEACPGRITSLTAAIHIIRLQQIESRISKTVCRVDRPVTTISPHKIAKLRRALDEWKARIPHQTTSREDGSAPETVTAAAAADKPPYSTTDYHMIQYHKALLLLFLPFLPSLTPAHPEFRQVAYSAGQICQLYKRLHDNQSYISFSLLALHANFVAGLVLVYCFCLDPSLFDTRFSSDLRACSSMLYTISERWPAARKVRSAFESLVAATVEGDHAAGSTTSSSASSREAAAARQPLPERTSRHPPPPPPHHHPSHEEAGSRTTTTTTSHLEDVKAASRPNDPVWDSFETVLGDYQISSETWMQDSIFLAMDAFPAEGWSAGAEIW